MPALNGIVNPGSWLGRTAILACVILLPFLGFLAGNRYPLLSVEALAGAGILVGMCALLGACFRGLAFNGLVIVAICAICAVPLQREASRWAAIPLAVSIAALAAVSVGLMAAFRERFHQGLATFAVGMFTAHVTSALLPAAVPVPAKEKPAHVLHLILDEHMGPGGLPLEIGACRRAADTICRTFETSGFELFPNAYSNYATTLDSIPSLLNRELLTRRHQFLRQPAPDAHGIYHAETGKFLDEYTRRGFAIRILQYRGIDYTNGDESEATEYSGTLAPLARAPGAWTDRFRLLVGQYQASDLLLARFKGFFPFRFGLRMVLPVSTEAVWPEGLVKEIEAASKPTLFLAHILSPHGPYLYRRDGTLREIPVWTGDEDYERLNPGDYEARYARYAEQVEYVQSQLGRLFGELQEAGLLEQMCVVVHGDHGSRILRQLPGQSAASVHGAEAVDRYDYAGPPDTRDLLDRFSVLLAVKLPGRHAYARNESRGSAQRFLSERLHGQSIDQSSTVNSAFLFNAKGEPQEIRMDKLWDH